MELLDRVILIVRPRAPFSRWALGAESFPPSSTAAGFFGGCSSPVCSAAGVWPVAWSTIALPSWLGSRGTER